MKINNILYLYLCLCFTSCLKCENRATLEYQSDLKQFPAYLVDFFPDTLSEKYSTIKNTDTTSYCISYMNYDFESKNIAKLSEYLATKSIKKYIASDVSLVTVKRESITYWDDSKRVYYTSLFKNHTFYYPVPFFEKEEFENIGVNNESIYSQTNVSGLSNDFEIYILESKSGLYWKGLKPNEYMPKGWKNGYSKGICINKKKSIIIYWLLVW